MKLAILCSGQAAQHPQMLDEFLTAPEFAALRNTASDTLGQDVSLWWRSLNADNIFSNANAQFAIALYQIAAWSRIATIVPTPVVVAGYSLGEVLAWHVAGAMDAATTLQLVRERATLMDKYAPPHGEEGCLVLLRGRSTPDMRSKRERIMDEHNLSIAIYRPDGDLVLGGAADDVSAFLKHPIIQQANVKRLKVSVPSHTLKLAEAVTPFYNIVTQKLIHDPTVSVLAGIDGSVLRHHQDAALALSQQLEKPLHWDWCEESLLSLGVDVALELGPGNDLAKLYATKNSGASARSVDDFFSIADLNDWLIHQ